MKHFALGLLLLLFAQHLCCQKVIENPHFRMRSGRAFQIEKIERAKDATRLHMALLLPEGYGISLDSANVYIEDVATNKKFYPVSVSGVNFHEWKPMPKSGRLEFVLTYPPLPATTTHINWIGQFDDAHTYGISLKPQKKDKKQELYGNWISQDGKNEWIIGLYDSLAIYKNEYWNYKEFKKKGKRYLITLENETGTCRLDLMQQKNGLCLVSEQNKEILCGKKPNNQLKPTPSNEDFTDFFRKDTAYIQGYLKGYDPVLGFSTGLIYLNNEITRDDYPTVVTIHPDGRFECKLVLIHPVSLSMSICNGGIPFYLEPGQKLTVFVDYESLTDFVRTWDNATFVKDLCYMGESASICRGIAKTQNLFGYDYKALDDYKKLTPEQYSQKRSHVLAEWENMADSIIRADNYSLKAARMLRNSAFLRHAGNMLDFVRMRNDEAMVDTTTQVLKVKEDDSYYDFLKQMPLDDYTFLACNHFSSFINRFEYMRLVFSRGYFFMDKGGNVDLVSSIIKDYEQTANRLKTFLGTDKIPFALQIAQVRSLNSTMSFLEDEELSKRFIEGLKANLSIPFLSEECDNMYNKIYADKSGSFILPEGKGKEIFTKIADKYKGKYLMVDFWATTCGPCRGEIKWSAELRKKYKGSKDIAFVFITSEDESPERDYVKYVEENLKDEDCYRIPASDYHYLRELFHFNGIPHYVTLNREGRVLRESLSYFSFEYGLLQLLEKEQENKE